MIKFKKPAAPKQEVVPTGTASLAARLTAARAEAEAFIQKKVDELKSLEEGKLLPRRWLEQNLRALNGGYCNCRVVLSILEKESDG